MLRKLLIQIILNLDIDDSLKVMNQFYECDLGLEWMLAKCLTHAS